MMCKLFFLLAAGSACLSSALAEGLKVGDLLPPLSTIDHQGESFSLQDYRSEQWVLVYFYPKADTPGCTKQACSLRDAYTQLTEAGVKVIGVSKDSVEEQATFAEKYQLPFTLIPDQSAKVIKAFGVKQMPVVGFPSRQAYLFRKGELVWKDLKASTEQQAQDVLAQVKGEAGSR